MKKSSFTLYLLLVFLSLLPSKINISSTAKQKLLTILEENFL